MMSANDWEIIKNKASIKEFNKGDIILKEGEKQPLLFIVDSGECEANRKTLKGKKKKKSKKKNNLKKK